jgi:hypothetical protein
MKEITKEAERMDEKEVEWKVLRNF